MKAVLDWLDSRTGVREIVRHALYESVPGGARWRYVWGSTLVFAFATQAVTGLFLWMFYSPSARRPGKACSTCNTRWPAAGCCAGCTTSWPRRWSC